MKSLNLMLRVSSLAVGALCAAVGVADEVVYTGQETGTIAVYGYNSPSGTNSTMVAVAFKELGVAGDDVSAANIVSTKNLNVGDQLFIYSNSGYVAWTLEQKEGYLAWEKVAAKFSVGSDGTLSNSAGENADDVKVPVGSGFWLTRKSGDLSAPFYIFGACVTPGTKYAAKGATSLMGNPCMEAKSPIVNTPAEGDSIQLISKAGFLQNFEYKTSPKDSALRWRGTLSSETPGGVPTPYEGINPPPIPAGAGFWYVSKGTSADVEFDWSDSSNN